MEGTAYLNPNYGNFIRKMEFNHFCRSFALVYAAVTLVIFLIGKCEGGIMDLGGNYELEFQQFTPCENDPSPYFNYSTKTVVNDDGVKVLEGTATLTKPVDDSQTLMVDAYRWGQNAAYQSMYRMDKKKACSYIKENFPGIFKKITDLIGNGENCPIQKGNFDISGIVLSGWTLDNLQRLPYGNYMLNLVIKDGDSVDVCIAVKVDVNQKA